MQARAIALITENLLAGGTKSIEDILVEAGYALDSARQQTNVMLGIRAHVDPIVERMEKLRLRALEHMEGTIKMASYADVTRAMHTLTHNIRLLSGKTTANLGVIHGERRGEIDRLIDE